MEDQRDDCDSKCKCSRRKSYVDKLGNSNYALPNYPVSNGPYSTPVNERNSRTGLRNNPQYVSTNGKPKNSAVKSQNDTTPQSHECTHRCGCPPDELPQGGIQDTKDIPVYPVPSFSSDLGDEDDFHIPTGDRVIGKDIGDGESINAFYLKNRYCPHCLVGFWADERLRFVKNTPTLRSVYKTDYSPFAEVPTVGRGTQPQVAGYDPFVRTKAKIKNWGTGSTFLMHNPLPSICTGMSNYMTSYNRYDPNNRLSLKPVMDFNRGVNCVKPSTGEGKLNAIRPVDLAYVDAYTRNTNTSPKIECTGSYCVLTPRK